MKVQLLLAALNARPEQGTKRMPKLNFKQSNITCFGDQDLSKVANVIHIGKDDFAPSDLILVSQDCFEQQSSSVESSDKTLLFMDDT